MSMMHTGAGALIKFVLVLNARMNARALTHAQHCPPLSLFPFKLYCRSFGQTLKMCEVAHLKGS